jgi:hypothetical protein
MSILDEGFNWHFPAGSTADGREIVRITRPGSPAAGRR